MFLVDRLGTDHAVRVLRDGSAEVWVLHDKELGDYVEVRDTWLDRGFRLYALTLVDALEAANGFIKDQWSGTDSFRKHEYSSRVAITRWDG